MNLGALGKGRSPSEALNTVIRTEAPYILGKKIVSSRCAFSNMVSSRGCREPFTGCPSSPDLPPSMLLACVEGWQVLGMP